MVAVTTIGSDGAPTAHSPARPAGSTSRNQGIDAFRYLLAYFVVLLHSLPGNAVIGDQSWPFWLSSICRAAVPFFFVASGYFVRPATGLGAVLKPLRRLLPIYLFWFAIYVAYDIVEGGIHQLPHASDLLTGGRAFHLWFLPALGIGLALVGFGLGRAGTLVTAGLCIALAAWGIATGSYHDALGLHGTAGRGGLFAAPLLVFLGAALRKAEIRPNLALSAVLVFVAYALGIIEEYALAGATGAPLNARPFIVSIFLLGPALFLLARDLPASPLCDRLSRLGGISLTVYASHLVFLRLISAHVDRSQPWEVLAMSLAVFALATLTATILRRIPLLRTVTA